MKGKILRCFVLIGLSNVLLGCCYIDFSDSVRELGDLYKAKIIAFYDLHGRYPVRKEDEQLIVELGCELRSQLDSSYICNYIEYEIQAGYGGILADGSGLLSEEVSLKLKRSSTICHYSFHRGKDGKFTINETKCYQTDCIRLRQ